MKNFLTTPTPLTPTLDLCEAGITDPSTHCHSSTFIGGTARTDIELCFLNAGKSSTSAALEV